MILCTDRNHVKYIRRFFKNIHRTDFLPHAGVELGHKHKPLNDRNIDVLYAGALPIYTVAKMIPDLHQGVFADERVNHSLENTCRQGYIVIIFSGKALCGRYIDTDTLELVR